MMELTGVVAGVAVLLALFVVRRSSHLWKEINQLKHDVFEARNRITRQHEEIRTAIQPLRVQVAKLASGGTVPSSLILEGRFFHEIQPGDAQDLFAPEMSSRPEGGIIDVRTAREYGRRRIPGAKLVSFEELDQQYEEAIPERAEKVLVYCQSGERSWMACEYLSSKGYTNLYHLRGGLQAWEGPTEGEGTLSLIQIDKKEVSSVR